MVLCEDGTLYTGVATDVVRRLCEHLEQGSRAARYTRSHRVVALAMLWTAPSRSDALSLEWHIHHSPRSTKLGLVRRPSRANDLVGAHEGGPRFHTVPSNWRDSYWRRAEEQALRVAAARRGA